MRQIQTSDKKVEEAPEVIADTYSQPPADISRYQFPVMTIPGPPSGSDNKAHVGEAIDKVKIPGDNRVSFSTLRHVIRSIHHRDHRRERQSGFAIGRQEGWQEGYQAGLAEGHQAGHDLS
nr:hypothetical protein [Endozoicomonas sp.]